MNRAPPDQKPHETHSKENKDVTLGLCGMNLENSCDSSVEVVGFGLRCVMDINRELTPRDYSQLP